MNKVIALITDFGYKDYYVGAIKAVIKSIAPDVELIDISHEIPHFSIWEGAFTAYYAFKFLPKNSVLLGIVDPSVGTSRKIIMAKTQDKWVIGPDNGLLYPILSSETPDEVGAIDPKDFHSSNTFQGRDIMAKVAAKIAVGEEVRVSRIKRIKGLKGWSFVLKCTKVCHGKIIYVDSFGNLISNIKSEAFRMRGKMKVALDNATFECVYSKNYSKEGVLIVPGGYGLIEIAISKSSAASKLAAKIGSAIYIEKI